MESSEAAAGKPAEPVTISVPEAGKMLGIGRNASYEAAHRGDIPVIKIGDRYRVPFVRLKKMLAGEAA